MVGLAAAGCGHQQRSETATPPAALSGATSEPERGESAKLDLGLVAVLARIGDRQVRSTGTVIDGDRGLILTSAHSVWGASSLKLATGVAVLHGRIVARAPCDDIALIETQPWVPGLEALPHAGGRLQPGPLTAVERVWNGNSGDIHSIPARAGSGRRSLRDTPVLANVLNGRPLSGALGLEASGGPLLDAAGNVAGLTAVVRGGDGRRRAAVVPMSLVQQRLADLRPGPGTIFAGWSEYYRCAPQQHRYAEAAYPGFRRSDARLDAPVAASRLKGTGGLDG
jgi:hypothetical protein